MNQKQMKTALICGIPGCLCYGGGDWLMIYGSPVHPGNVYQRRKQKNCFGLAFSEHF